MTIRRLENGKEKKILQSSIPIEAREYTESVY